MHCPCTTPVLLIAKTNPEPTQNQPKTNLHHHTPGAEYADTIHAVLTALEAATLPPIRLAVLLAGYLGLVLFTVYLSSAEVRLPMVQYSSTPPQVRLC